MNEQYNYKSNRSQDTFKALVNAIIPRSPGLAYYYGVVQYYGALDLHIDEYVILTLNSLGMPLAEPTAEMLDITTGSFIALNQYSQLYALTLLNQLQINLSHLPILFILSILPIPF